MAEGECYDTQRRIRYVEPAEKAKLSQLIDLIFMPLESFVLLQRDRPNAEKAEDLYGFVILLALADIEK